MENRITLSVWFDADGKVSSHVDLTGDVNTFGQAIDALDPKEALTIVIKKALDSASK